MRRIVPIALVVLLGILAWFGLRALATPMSQGSQARPAAEDETAAGVRSESPTLRATSEVSELVSSTSHAGVERVASRGIDLSRAPIEGRVQAPLGADPLVDYALSVGGVAGPFETVLTDALGHFVTANSYEAGLVRVQHLDEYFTPETHLPLTTLEPTPMPMRSEAFRWQPHGNPLVVVGAAGATVRIEFAEPCPYPDEEVLVRMRAITSSRSSSRISLNASGEFVIGESFVDFAGAAPKEAGALPATQLVHWSIATRLRRDEAGAWARFPAVVRGRDRGFLPFLLSVESLDGVWMQETPYNRGQFTSGRPGSATVVPAHASQVWVGTNAGRRSVGLPVALTFGPATPTTDAARATPLPSLGTGWWELIHVPPGRFVLRGGGLRIEPLDLVGHPPADGRLWFEVPARRRPLAGALAGTLVRPDVRWERAGEVNGYVELLRPASDAVLETALLKWERLEGGALECWFYFSDLPAERFELRVAGQEERVAADPPNDEVRLTWR